MEYGIQITFNNQTTNPKTFSCEGMPLGRRVPFKALQLVLNLLLEGSVCVINCRKNN